MPRADLPPYTVEQLRFGGVHLCHIHVRTIVGNGSKRPQTPCARATRNARGLDRTSVRQVIYAESDTVELWRRIDRRVRSNTS
jgi:hypothetical protein